MRLRTRYTQRLPVAPGLRLDIPFFEGSGTKVLDVSGKGNHGTITDAVWTRDENGVAMSFNGTSAYIDCGNDASLNITKEITIEMWVKFDDLTNRSYTIAKGKYTSDGWYWRVISDGSWSVAYNWSGNGYYPDSGIDLPTGEWLHLVTVLDNVTPRVDFYKNGVWQAYTNPSQSFIGNADRTLLIGKSHDGYPHNGAIDEVRIYAVALTASQIKRRYEQTKRDYVRAH